MTWLKETVFSDVFWIGFALMVGLPYAARFLLGYEFALTQFFAASALYAVLALIFFRGMHNQFERGRWQAER